jgi:hypothetical protein
MTIASSSSQYNIQYIINAFKRQFQENPEQFQENILKIFQNMLLQNPNATIFTIQIPPLTERCMQLDFNQDVKQQLLVIKINELKKYAWYTKTKLTYSINCKTLHAQHPETKETIVFRNKNKSTKVVKYPNIKIGDKIIIKTYSTYQTLSQ